MENNIPSNKVTIIKNLYLYLVSFAALMMIVVSSATLLGNVLKLTVFPQADNWYTGGYIPYGCEGGPIDPGRPTSTPEQCAKEKERYQEEQEKNKQARLQQSVVWSISFLIVAIPLFGFHWHLIRKKEHKV